MSDEQYLMKKNLNLGAQPYNENQKFSKNLTSKSGNIFHQKVILPSIGKQIGIFLSLLLLLYFFAYLISIDSLDSVIQLVTMEKFNLGKSLYAIFALSALKLYTVSIFVSIIQRYPRLVISADGLQHIRIFRTKYWSWEEIGPFSVMSFSNYPTTSYGAGAFSYHNHQIFEAGGQSSVPTWSDADIKIPLNLILKGRSNHNKAQDLVDELNEWRDKFEYKESPISKDKIDDKLSKLNNKLMWRSFGYILILAIIPFIPIIFYAG